MADKGYTALLLEEIRDQNKAVLEAVSDMKQQVAMIPAMREDIAELKQDVQVIKVAVRDLSNEVGGLSDQVEHHEHRIRHLEGAGGKRVRH